VAGAHTNNIIPSPHNTLALPIAAITTITTLLYFATRERPDGLVEREALIWLCHDCCWLLLLQVALRLPMAMHAHSHICRANTNNLTKAFHPCNREPQRPSCCPGRGACHWLLVPEKRLCTLWSVDHYCFPTQYDHNLSRTHNP